MWPLWRVVLHLRRHSRWGITLEATITGHRWVSHHFMATIWRRSAMCRHWMVTTIEVSSSSRWARRCRLGRKRISVWGIWKATLRGSIVRQCARPSTKRRRVTSPRCYRVSTRCITLWRLRHPATIRSRVASAIAWVIVRLHAGWWGNVNVPNSRYWRATCWSFSCGMPPGRTGSRCWAARRSGS
jgi:hypothetical protein